MAVLGTVLLFLGKLLLIHGAACLAVASFCSLPLLCRCLLGGETLSTAGAHGADLPECSSTQSRSLPLRRRCHWLAREAESPVCGLAGQAQRACRQENIAPAKPKESTPPKQKAKLTLQVVCTLARGCGGVMGAVLGALRFTKIDVCLGVRGEDPAGGSPQLWPPECLALPGAGRAGPDLLPAI